MSIRRLLPALMLVAAVATAQVPGARATVDSTGYLIGDAIHVHVALTHPKGAVVQPAVGDSLGGFTVLAREAIRQQTDTSGSMDVVVARYDSGSAVLPPIPFRVTVPGDSAVRTVETNPLLLTVRTVPVDTTKDIRDLKPPMSIPISLAEILTAVGIAAAVLLLAYGVYRYWKRRARRATGTEYVPPPRPAHEIALEELALVKEKKLWQRGLIKEYYSEVTEVLRRYIENRWQVRALEETTDEILTGLTGTGIAGDLLRSVEKGLRRADLVKFAKAQPGIPEHEEMMTIAYDTVERTKAAPQPATVEQHATGAGGGV